MALPPCAPFACYLLVSQSRAHVDHTYIGFTVHPPRRLRQHNGEIKGGAHHTHKKRPWAMVLVVQGFPTKLSALQFEWAWQNPQLSRHFHQMPPTTDALSAGSAPGKRGRRRGRLPARLAPSLLALARLLHMPLWARLGLRLNFTTPELLERFRRLRPTPPSHMVWLQRPLAALAPSKEAALDLDDDEDEDEDDEDDDDEDGSSGSGSDEGDAVDDEFQGRAATKRPARTGSSSSSQDDRPAAWTDWGAAAFDDDGESAAPWILTWTGASPAEADRPSSVPDGDPTGRRGCAVCAAPLASSAASTATDLVHCVHSGCRMTAHLACLARRFLDAEPAGPGPRPLIPCAGACPACHQRLLWTELVHAWRRRRQQP